jgi:hypothetical protein
VTRVNAAVVGADEHQPVLGNIFERARIASNI